MLSSSLILKESKAALINMKTEAAKPPTLLEATPEVKTRSRSKTCRLGVANFTTWQPQKSTGRIEKSRSTRTLGHSRSAILKIRDGKLPMDQIKDSFKRRSTKGPQYQALMSITFRLRLLGRTCLCVIYCLRISLSLGKINLQINLQGQGRWPRAIQRRT